MFNLAFGTTEGPTQLAMFQAEAAMPRGAATEYTQGEFDIVAEWFARGLPMIDVVIPADPPPTQCTTNITSEVATHVATMATQGWRAVNRSNGILMFGCAGAATARDCLASYPAASASPFSSTWEGALAGQRIRVLRTNNYASSYWTRSSADGRFVGSGGGAGGSTFFDLSNGREIPASASYDPGFFPDNSGFVMQGGSRPWCRQSLLTSNPTSISFTEPECSAVSVVGLYQHLGAVRGGDYWAVAGQFVSDNGGGEPGASFGASGHSDLTPMIWSAL